MKENKHTIGDLYKMQSLPLEAKIKMTKYRIQEWIVLIVGQLWMRKRNCKKPIFHWKIFNHI